MGITCFTIILGCNACCNACSGSITVTIGKRRKKRSASVVEEESRTNETIHHALRYKCVMVDMGRQECSFEGY